MKSGVWEGGGFGVKRYCLGGVEGRKLVLDRERIEKEGKEKENQV